MILTSNCMRKVCCFFFCVLLLVVGSSCRHRHYHDAADSTEVSNSRENNRNDDSDYREERSIRKGTRVRMEKADGVYLVPIKVNGLPLKFIFDTGASSICISSAEAAVMARQGHITQDDVVGQQQFKDATGDISVGTVIRLRTVEIGGIMLHNVEASVVDNISAPLLLGQTALSKFGKISIDYNEGYIEFN